MNNSRLFILSFFLSASLATQAQIVDDLDDDLFEEEEELTDTLDTSMDFPESMTDNIDSLMNLYVTKTYLEPDADCNMQDVNPEFTREQYVDRLQRMPTVMEMTYNEEVRACIDRYTARLRRSVSYMLGAVNFYMPIFEEALDAYQLPLELKYLPVIESALNPTAVSRVGATGLWQFMLTTGKAYGLEVTSLTDDRRDPVKSSYAAARYLRDLYQIFGDWNLVIAAYNCGPENINKAIRRSGGQRDYWAIFPYLPKETRGYVPAFIAANYVMTYYCDHNICPMRSRLPVKTDTVMVNRNITLDQIAATCNLDIEMLRSLNPVYRRDIVPGATSPSAIRLPLADVGTLIDALDTIYAKAAQNPVKRPEVEVSNERNPAVKERPARNNRNNGGRATYHTIRRGDTLSAIARRYGTTVNKIKQINGLRSNNIRVGKRIRVK